MTISYVLINEFNVGRYEELLTAVTAPFKYVREEWRKMNERDGYRSLNLQFPPPQPNSHDRAYYSGSLNAIIEEGLDFRHTIHDIRDDFYHIYSELDTETLEHAKNIAAMGAILFKNNESLLLNRYETVAAEFFINVCRALAVAQMRADIYQEKSGEIFQASRNQMDSLLTAAAQKMEQIRENYKPIDTDIATAELMVQFAKESSLPLPLETVQDVEKAADLRQDELGKQNLNTSENNHPGPKSEKIAGEERTGWVRGKAEDSDN